jgi:hypothetical protein
MIDNNNNSSLACLLAEEEKNSLQVEAEQMETTCER